MFYAVNNIDSGTMTMIVVVVALIAVPSAWITDAVLQTAGFGVMGNYVLLALGAYFGVYAAIHHIGSIEFLYTQPRLFAASVAIGAFANIIVFALLKRIVSGFAAR